MHVLLFDIDGTLIHAGGAGRAALLAALAAEFAIGEPRLDLEFAGRTDRSIFSDALRQNGLEADETMFARYLASYLRHLPESLADRRGRVLPGVRELLEALASRDDVALGLLTGNFERAAGIKLAHFGIDSYFAFGGYGDLHFDRDDVARAAQLAIRPHCGEDRESLRIWVVGDTPLDVRCARDRRSRNRRGQWVRNARGARCCGSGPPPRRLDGFTRVSRASGRSGARREPGPPQPRERFGRGRFWGKCIDQGSPFSVARGPRSFAVRVGSAADGGGRGPTMWLGRTAAAMAWVLMAVLGLTSAAFADEACDGAVSAAWSALTAECGCEAATGSKWKRERSEYLQCVRAFALEAAATGALPASCRGSLLRAAKNSTCSRPPEAIPCCRTDSSGDTQCKIVNDPTKCESRVGRLAEFGTTELCLDACANASVPLCSRNSDCDDGDACTIDVCTAATGCSHFEDPSCNPPPPPPPPPPPGGEACSGTGTATHGLSEEEQTLLQLINHYRISRGRPGIAGCRSLDRAAQDHANDMRDRSYFAHKSKDGTEFWERACEAGFLSGCGSLPQTWMGEIIAGYAADAEGAMWQWENSGGHAGIMQDPAYAVLGIGHACGGPMANYWVVDFAGRTEASCN